VIIGALALALMSVLPAIASGTPTLATDKPDYSPGEVVHITGTGFAAGSYDVPVLRPDGSIVLVDPVTHLATPGWGTTAVGDDGALAYDYQLNGIAGSYEARAYASPWSGDWSEAPVASVTFTDLVVDFKQCANDDPSTNPPVDTGDCHWIGSIIQEQNSQYSEGMALPQRVVFDGIVATTGNIHTLTFDHEFTKGGIHAFDFLVSYEDADVLATQYGFPYDDLIGQTCFPEIGPPNTLDDTCEDLRTGANHLAVEVPNDAFVSKDGTVQSRINAYETAYGNRTIDIYGNAPITSASLTMSHNVANGGDTGDSQANYVLTWTSSSTSILITYATHISIGGDPALNAMAWGINLGASSISGGPYHNNIRQLDGNALGAQDNQLKGEDLVAVPPTVATTSSPTGGNVVPGTQATDTATVNGSAGPGTGTVSFFLCGPGLATAASATTGCPTGGTQIGGAVALVSGSATSAATSSAQTLGIGLYCWRAEYTPSAGSPYTAASHTNATSECFTTVKQPSTTATTSSPTGGSVVPGTSATDTATVTGIAGGPAPTGTVTFFLCQPADVTAGGCEGSAGSQVGSPVNLVATNPQVDPPTASATSSATTNTTAIGKYCWRAEYSGDSFYNSSSHTNATSECFTTVKQPSTTATTSNPNSTSIMPGTSVTDTATVTGILGGPAPTGTVTFFLCQPATVTANGGDCSAGGSQVGSPVNLVATNPQVDPPTASATSAATTNTVDPGKYCWRAVYSGDGFYNGSSHTNSTTECFTVMQTIHPGTIGFWRNWRNHYTSAQFQLLINYLKTNNAAIYNEDLTNGTSDDLTIAKIDAIFDFGKKTPRNQMVLAQFTALKLNLAITQLDGTGGLVQKNDDLCLTGTVNVSGIPGAGTLFEGAGSDNILTVAQVVTFIESRWDGTLTTNRNNWTFGGGGSLTNGQWDILIKVITGMNEGMLIVTDGCP
jgi:hypothetical protein